MSVKEGFIGCVGNTPLIKIPSLSRLTGCDILVKAEYLNPGGSIKDRAALSMITAALESGKVKEGGIIVEATSGNTGVGLAHVCKAKNLRCIFVCPDNVSAEKIQQLKLLGAEKVHVVPRVAPDHPDFYQKVAKRLAVELGGLCLDQYNNLANYEVHVKTTGPEIYEQTNGKIDYFVATSGTGGSIAGCSTYFKSVNENIKIILIDVEGSIVKITKPDDVESVLREKNLAFTDSLREREPSEVIGVKTAIEGIGPSSLFENLKEAKVDGMISLISDAAGIQMLHYLLNYEGIFLGGSSGANVCGAFLLAKLLGPGHTLVTFGCDGGARYASKFYNEAWLKEYNVDVSPEIIKDLKFLDNFEESVKLEYSKSNKNNTGPV